MLSSMSLTCGFAINESVQLKALRLLNFNFISVLKFMFLTFAGTLNLCFTTGQTRPCLPIGKNGSLHVWQIAYLQIGHYFKFRCVPGLTRSNFVYKTSATGHDPSGWLCA